MPSYSGGTIQNTSWTQSTGTKQELADKIEIEFLAAGWSTISGSGTTNLLMQSATSTAPESLNIRVRIKGTNTNCVSMSIENVAGTKVGGNSTTAGIMLLPAASKAWRFVVCKYQFAIFTAAPSAAREFAMGGIPHLPNHLQGVITECAWIMGNASSDTDTTLRKSFRNALGTQESTSQQTNFQVLCNGNIWEDANNTGVNNNNTGHVMLAQLWCLANSAAQTYTWHDDSANFIDPIIGWGLTAGSDQAKGRGILWNAVLSSESYAGDQTVTFDSHNWITITHNNTGSNSNTPRGTLLLATS